MSNTCIVAMCYNFLIYKFSKSPYQFLTRLFGLHTIGIGLQVRDIPAFEW